MSLNKLILEVAENYFFGDKSLYNQSCDLAKLLFPQYVEDKNSSTIREEIVLSHLGYIKEDKKHGPDGFHPERKCYVEVKPMFAHLDENGKQNYLTGGGTFNDLTFEKLEKVKDDDLVCAGFAEDKIIYIVRFPYKHILPYLSEKLKENIAKNLKRQGTISFGYNLYKDCDQLEILHLDIGHIDRFTSKPMAKFLKTKFKVQND